MAAAETAEKQPTRELRALAFAAACGFDFRRRGLDPRRVLFSYIEALDRIGADLNEPSDAEGWAAAEEVAKKFGRSVARVLELVHQERRHWPRGRRPSRVPQKSPRD